MVADPSHTISRIFDVLDEESGLSQRGTLLSILMALFKRLKSMRMELDAMLVD